MALVKEYFELTNKYQQEYGVNTILLMMVGSFFEVYGLLDENTKEIYGSRIQDFSSICELNIVEKNVCVGKNNVCMAGFKDIMLEKYIKKIQDAGFTCVVYTQDESAPNTTRSLFGIFSPGTYFSNESKFLTNNLTCIWVELIENKMFMKGKYVIVGVSNIDVYTGKTSIFQFKELYINNPTTFDELERFISIYNPSEVIIISNLQDTEVNDVLNYANIQSKLIHKINLNNNPSENKIINMAKNCEKQIYQIEILNKFYKIDNFDIFIQNFNENNTATQSFCFLLDFAYKHNPYLVNKISEPIFENCSDRLILANHSLKQLNIIDDNNYTGKYSSVLKILNICLTPMGKRKFTHVFLNPTTNIEYLKNEYNIIEHIIEEYDNYNQYCKSNLCNIKDLSKYQRQLLLKKISPKSFYDIFNSLTTIKNMYDNLRQYPKVINYLKKNNIQTDKIIEYCDMLLSLIDTNLDINMIVSLEQTQQFDCNFIKQGIDLELDNKTKIMIEDEDKLNSIKHYFNELIDNSEKKTKNKTNINANDYVKIHETEKNNYSLISTSRRCKLLENSLPDVKTFVKLIYNSSYTRLNQEFEFKICKKDVEFHKQSNSNNYITNEEITQICKGISNVKSNIKELITKVYYLFVDKFSNFNNEMDMLINFVTLIDLIYTKSTLAIKYNYCKPVIENSNKSFVNIQNLRHCLIEQLQTNELYVTNDIILGDGTTDGILLYGTNAVGKTSLIRALGISVIMAQSGLYVPASSFIYKPYNYIFTRILGNDNIFKGLSTFAVEMSELRTILRLSNENSLILGDELCSGTENISAISIFVSGIEKLYNSKSSYIFATHLHEIVDYEEIQNIKTLILKHMSVIYDKESDMLIYDRKLKDGPGNNMYGLEVCKSLSLPDDFLKRAYDIRSKYYSDAESILLLKKSHYNSNKIVYICEKCNKNIGTEVHHLQHQQNADKNGNIKTNDNVFNKNVLANLLTLCEDCHKTMHKVNKQHKKVKTTMGYKITEI